MKILDCCFGWILGEDEIAKGRKGLNLRIPGILGRSKLAMEMDGKGGVGVGVG